MTLKWIILEGYLQVQANPRTLKYRDLEIFSWHGQVGRILWSCWVWNSPNFLMNEVYIFIWKLELNNMKAPFHSFISSVHMVYVCVWIQVSGVFLKCSPLSSLWSSVWCGLSQNLKLAGLASLLRWLSVGIRDSLHLIGGTGVTGRCSHICLT